MNKEAEAIRRKAKERMGRDAPIIDKLVDGGTRVTNLDWYLREKIVKPSEEDFKNHRRVLKYAYNFLNRGAAITFVIEKPDAPSPDLKVETVGISFNVEVKKFELKGASKSPAEKIVTAVQGKIRQLVHGEINFVAIDNFDINLEDVTAPHIRSAFGEIERMAAGNPGYYQVLSGVIFSSMMASEDVPYSGRLARNFPEYVWVNKGSNPPVPEELQNWLIGVLPGGRPFSTANGPTNPKLHGQ